MGTHGAKQEMRIFFWLGRPILNQVITSLLISILQYVMLIKEECSGVNLNYLLPSDITLYVCVGEFIGYIPADRNVHMKKAQLPRLTKVSLRVSLITTLIKNPFV